MRSNKPVKLPERGHLGRSPPSTSPAPVRLRLRSSGVARRLRATPLGRQHEVSRSSVISRRGRLILRSRCIFPLRPGMESLSAWGPAYRSNPKGMTRKQKERVSMARSQLLAYPRAGSQLAFARVATALAVVSVGALAIGSLAVGRLAIKRVAIASGRIDRLSINELEVNRLRVHELITEQAAA